MLIKVDPHRLIKQPVLHGGAALSEAQQAKEAGSISFIDGNFQVASGIEERQLFAFRYIGIGFADSSDHFISFENDLEAASAALHLKLFAGYVHDDVLEIINEDDLAFDPVLAEERTEMVLFSVTHIGDTDMLQAGTIDDLLYGLAHFAGAVKRVLDGRPFELQTDHHFRFVFQDHGEQAIIGAEDVLILVICQEQLFWLLFE